MPKTSLRNAELNEVLSEEKKVGFEKKPKKDSNANATKAPPAPKSAKKSPKKKEKKSPKKKKTNVTTRSQK